MLTLVIIVVLTALTFEYINGFHDTANSIATVVATKVLSPMQAVALAATMNLAGALAGTAVAKTIASGLINLGVVEVGSHLILAALVGGIVWNLITWWKGLPSSSSHALIGGLLGAALAAASNNPRAIIWSEPAEPLYRSAGVLWKVIVPMVSSPVLGFVAGFLLMGLLFAVISMMASGGGVMARMARPRWVNGFFGKFQIVSAAGMGFAHGLNDAQKTMGIIALALVSAQIAGTLDALPPWLAFLHPSPGALAEGDIDTWIKITCALVMA
ncbi:MAG: inorganic phosphate transporter, partial [Pseudomonadota bacterium]|nr:inorganic phosphate transporter [Pseudomonadota bacterium]